MSGGRLLRWVHGVGGVGLRRQLGGVLSALWHLDGLIVGGLVAVVGVIGAKREVPIVVRAALLLIPVLLLAVVGYFLVFSVG